MQSAMSYNVERVKGLCNTAEQRGWGSKTEGLPLPRTVTHSDPHGIACTAYRVDAVALPRYP